MYYNYYPDVGPGCVFTAYLLEAVIVVFIIRAIMKFMYSQSTNTKRFRYSELLKDPSGKGLEEVEQVLKERGLI
ncbi:MAG: hypothetical protein NC827_08380 [Candidatus Omnitrophica bacterium]|nr:hypothetical protein [Candidatus Omnitrophota bacterium]MCM8803306.1 hypothetical protein [Candidatus Omnitrophota bacterium]